MSDIAELIANAVGVETLGTLPVFRRLRRARVVVTVDPSTGKSLALRGAKVWADILARRTSEFYPEKILIILARGSAERMFAVFAETMSRL